MKMIPISCPKCKEADLTMIDVTTKVHDQLDSQFTMTYFTCPKCQAMFYNNGWDLSEVKK